MASAPGAELGPTDEQLWKELWERSPDLTQLAQNPAEAAYALRARTDITQRTAKDSEGGKTKQTPKTA